MSSSLIKAIWEKNENRYKLPSRCREIIISDFEEIKLTIEKRSRLLRKLKKRLSR